jgi:DNA-directed RNA polymerase specialized sigma24 family protein
MDVPPESELLLAARRGDPAAFERLVSRHRRELYAHCYRMLGSVQDAELPPGVLARRLARPGLLRRPKLPARLAIPNHHQRLPAVDLAPATADPLAGLWAPMAEHRRPWQPRDGTDLVGAWQDDEPAGEPSDVDPATQYLRRESVELAFVAALQHLPGTRRAVLILRDVLQFSSVEVARILDITPTAVNSAMQRARKSVHQRVPEKTQQAELDAMGTAGSRELVDAFMRAWERAITSATVTGSLGSTC